MSKTTRTTSTQLWILLIWMTIGLHPGVGVAQQGSAHGNLNNTTLAGVPGNISYIAAFQLRKDDGSPLGAGGVAVAPGGSISFSGRQGGYWAVNNGEIAKVSFRDSTGSIIFQVGVANQVTWTIDGTVTDGLANLLSIVTLKDGKEVTDTIASRRQINGAVELTTGEGNKYTISDFRYNFEGAGKKDSAMAKLTARGSILWLFTGLAGLVALVILFLNKSRTPSTNLTQPDHFGEIT